MKQYPLLFLIAILAAVIACSRTQKTDKTVNNQLRTHKEAIDTLHENTAAAAAMGEVDEAVDEEEQSRETKPLEINILPADESRELLTIYSLSPLFVVQPDVENEDYASAVVNGFYGQDHYRIEVHFASMVQDADHPNVYHLEGKTRYKKNITPFKGTLTLDNVHSIKDPNISTEDMQQMEAEKLYAATGHFELREDAASYGAGTFAGQVKVCFVVKKDNNLRLWYYSQTDPASGAGFVFDGDWTSYKTGKSKPILWAHDLFMIANNVLENFSIGERDVQINPKYRRLGWDNFWENEEWWAESPKAL